MTLRLAILTTGRQDWGNLRPLCEDLHIDPAFDLILWAGGMACDPRFSRVADEAHALGLPIQRRMEWDPEAGPADQAAEALRSTTAAMREDRPDAVVLLGDRFETAAAALAATLERIPIIHLYGGEETAGAFDDALRHAVSKMSHLHFVAHDHYRRRLIAMGEDPAAIHPVGLLSLDLAARMSLPDRADLERDLGVRLEPPVGMVTLHPATLGAAPEVEFAAVAGAMSAVPATWIVSLPNADPGGLRIRKLWEGARTRIPRLHCFPALGEARYLGLLRLAAVVLGNSSSGLTEAPAFGVPTVNIGDRQKGRLRSLSVIDAPPSPEAVTSALHRALDPGFRRSLEGMEPAYGRGNACAKVLSVLRSWTPPIPPSKKAILV